MSFIQPRQLNLFPIPHSTADRMILQSGIKQTTLYAFAIPTPIVEKYYKYYKLLYWSGHHILDAMEAGILTRDNISFYAKYHDSLTRGKIVQNPGKQYALSFRAPIDGMGDAYVLISEAKV